MVVTCWVMQMEEAGNAEELRDLLGPELVWRGEPLSDAFEDLKQDCACELLRKYKAWRLKDRETRIGS